MISYKLCSALRSDDTYSASIGLKNARLNVELPVDLDCSRRFKIPTALYCPAGRLLWYSGLQQSMKIWSGYTPASAQVVQHAAGHMTSNYHIPWIRPCLQVPRWLAGWLVDRPAILARISEDEKAVAGSNTDTSCHAVAKKGGRA